MPGGWQGHLQQQKEKLFSLLLYLLFLFCFPLPHSHLEEKGSWRALQQGCFSHLLPIAIPPLMQLHFSFLTVFLPWQ